MSQILPIFTLKQKQLLSDLESGIITGNLNVTGNLDVAYETTTTDLYVFDDLLVDPSGTMRCQKYKVNPLATTKSIDFIRDDAVATTTVTRTLAPACTGTNTVDSLIGVDDSVHKSFFLSYVPSDFTLANSRLDIGLKGYNPFLTIRNGRVGINAVTNPSYNLEVTGSTNSTSLYAGGTRVYPYERNGPYGVNSGATSVGVTTLYTTGNAPLFNNFTITIAQMKFDAINAPTLEFGYGGATVTWLTTAGAYQGSTQSQASAVTGTTSSIPLIQGNTTTTNVYNWVLNVNLVHTWGGFSYYIVNGNYNSDVPNSGSLSYTVKSPVAFTAFRIRTGSGNINAANSSYATISGPRVAW